MVVENYTKDLKERIYHGSVVSALGVGFTMLGKSLIKMSPPPTVGKCDVEDGVKLVAVVAISDFTNDSCKKLAKKEFLVVYKVWQPLEL